MISEIFSIDLWLLASNIRIESISSPQSSIRTGVLFEAMPKRGKLTLPGDYFTLTDRITFTDAETNTTDEKKSNRFQEEMQKKGRAGTSRAGKIALYGMMTALAFLLSYVETLIPINLGVPGVKLGLANLASIVSLYLLGAGAAAAIALVRIVLVGFTFGNLSMMLYSLAGAAVSLLLMVVFRRLDWFGVTGVSILGGAGHNIGQLIVEALDGKQ